MALPFHKRRLDPDAAEFCRASGATDRRAISDFVRGMKGLGLWDSMVCWPLRSTQNASGGTTAFSLGGLGTYNGTLTNGPTWGADGVNFLGGSYYIALPLVTAAATITANGGYSSFSALNFISMSSSEYNAANSLNFKIRGGQFHADSSSTEVRFASAESGAGGERYTSQTLAAGTIVGAGFKTCFGCLKSDGSGLSVLDTSASSTTVSSGGTSPPPPFVDGTAGRINASFGTPWSGSLTLALQMFVLKPMTASEAVSLRTLYKSTLGQGLSLA